jgi:hypothetical protein
VCDRIALCIHEAFNAASDLTLFTATSFDQAIDALLLGTQVQEGSERQIVHGRTQIVHYTYELPRYS